MAGLVQALHVCPCLPRRLHPARAQHALSRHSNGARVVMKARETFHIEVGAVAMPCTGARLVPSGGSSRWCMARWSVGTTSRRSSACGASGWL